MFENWCEYTYSPYSLFKSNHGLMKTLQISHTLSLSVINGLFPFCLIFSYWNVSFSNFSFLVLTTQHWVSGISRQKKWSHVSAFQTFQHCGCFQHCCPNEQPVFVIWAILGWHWWPLAYLQHLLRCYFQELRCCGELRCFSFFLFFGRKCFLIYFTMVKFPLN